MSPFGDRRYGIRYLRGLRLFISGPNELTEPKFNTHTPKDLYNLIKKILLKKFYFFLLKTAFFHFIKCLFGGLPIKITKEKGYRKCFLNYYESFSEKVLLKKCPSPSGCLKNIFHSFFKFYEFYRQ